MSCYICNNAAEYSCHCSSPNALICESHLKFHLGNTSVKHLFVICEMKETNLLIELKQKSINIKEEIVGNANYLIQKITEQTKKSFNLLNEFINNMYENFLQRR